MSGDLTHDPDTNAPPPPSPLTRAEIKAYLDYALEPMVTRRAEIIAALERQAQLPEGVTRLFIADGDEELAGAISDNLTMARQLLNALEKRREKEKKPFLEGGREVDEWPKVFAIPLARAMHPLEMAMNDYGGRKAAIERKAREEEARRAKEEADRARREAEAALKAKTPDVNERLEDASKAAAKADSAERKTTASGTTLGRTTGNFGGSVAPRVSWEWELTDPALVPREYLMVNPEAVKIAAGERDPVTRKPLAVIPGIQWVEYRTTGSVKTRVTP